jgi:SAM-dependent methyltransferase
MTALKNLLRPIYYWGPRSCTACGRQSRTLRTEVMWEGLGSEWDLTPQLYEQFSEREGVSCAKCGANWRARHLAQVLLDDVSLTRAVRSRSVAELAERPEVAGLQVAEINAVAGLHPFLALLPGLRYSEFGSRVPQVPSEDLSRLSYADGAFDYVLTSDTLEHVPDFDQAMREIHRVLKPGAKHIFTIPVIWERRTRQRAELTKDGIRHRLPPSYHAGPGQDLPDYLVFNEFGSDVLDRIARSGFSVSVKQARANPVVSTIIAQRID